MPPGKSDAAILQTPSEESTLTQLASRFPLPWSAYVRLLAVKSQHARLFYETEAMRGGWSVRQLDRQIQSQFYERTALSRNKAAFIGSRVCWTKSRTFIFILAVVRSFRGWSIRRSSKLAC